jgi:hypothetical protein
MSDFSYDFSAQATQNPWTVPGTLIKLSSTNFSLTNGTGVRSASNGNVAWGAHNATYTCSTTPIDSEITYNAIVFNHDEGGAGVFVRTGGNAGAGYSLRVAEDGTAYIDRCTAAFATTQLASTSGLTLAASDVFKLRYVASTGALTGYQNGVQKLTVTDTTYQAESTLAAGWWINPGNTNSQYIKTFAGTGVATTTTTLTPGVGAVTASGLAPTGNAFSNVRIREVLINEAGSPVANQTGIHLLVWYSGFPAGAADLSYSNMTTDPTGTTSWSLATGTLIYNQRIFYVAHDGHASLSVYTCAQMQPTYS